MSQQSRLLAIDASVLRSAGGREQGHSAHCTQVLDTVQSKGHRVAFCAATSQEWNKHQSFFSSKWRSAMIARKKMVPLNTQLTQSKLQSTIAALAGLSKNSRKALEKDIHMLALAIDADKILITGDNTLKKLTLQSEITPALEWLIAQPDNSALERQKQIDRLHELAKNKPHPPLPS